MVPLFSFDTRRGNSYFGHIKNTRVIKSNIINSLTEVEPFADITRHKGKIVIPASTGLSAGTYHLYDPDLPATGYSEPINYTYPFTGSNKIYKPVQLRPYDKVLYANLKISPTGVGTCGSQTIDIITMNPTSVATSIGGSIVGQITVDDTLNILGSTDALSGKTAGITGSNLSFGVTTTAGITGNNITDTIIAVDIITISIP